MASKKWSKVQNSQYHLVYKVRAYVYACYGAAAAAEVKIIVSGDQNLARNRIVQIINQLNMDTLRTLFSTTHLQAIQNPNETEWNPTESNLLNSFRSDEMVNKVFLVTK